MLRDSWWSALEGKGCVTATQKGHLFARDQMTRYKTLYMLPLTHLRQELYWSSVARQHNPTTAAIHSRDPLLKARQPTRTSRWLRTKPMLRKVLRRLLPPLRHSSPRRHPHQSPSRHANPPIHHNTPDPLRPITSNLHQDSPCRSVLLHLSKH